MANITTEPSLADKKDTPSGTGPMRLINAITVEDLAQSSTSLPIQSSAPN